MQATDELDARRLGDVLHERQDEILALWESQVRLLRSARGLTRPVLLDHIPDFLRELASFVGELRDGHQAAAPQEFPIIHAIERLDLGYDLTEVVAEYGILRKCIVTLVARGGSPSTRSA